MKQVNLLPNIITAFGLSCGLYIIFRVNLLAPEVSLFQILLGSAILLLIASLADVLDGAVARAIRAETEFGFSFDSLADAITFGVVPSVLLLKSLSLEQGSFLAFFCISGAMFYSICGVLRLARFNVSQQITPTKTSLLYKKSFIGLPIPAAALSAVSANLFLISPMAKNMFSLPLHFRNVFLTILMVMLGFLMISHIYFPSLKSLHMRPRSFSVVFVTGIVAIFLLYGLLHHFPIVFIGISWGYILFSLILFFLRKQKVRKN